MASAKVNPPSWSRVEFIAAAVLSAWVLTLHVFYLFHAGPLWRDEVGTIDFATMPTLGDIWHNLQYDNFPPLFVGLARVWTTLGFASDFGLRVLGFLIAFATLGVFWFSARVCGGRVPLLALALYAANPLAVRVGDSLRPYGLGIALIVLTMALIWRFVESPRPRNLVWATIAAVLSVQCLYHNAFFLIAFSVAAWAVTSAHKQWKTAAQIGIIGFVAALSLLPHWSNIQKGQDWLGIAWRPVHVSDIVHTLTKALAAPGVGMVWIWAGCALLALAAAVIHTVRVRDNNIIYCATTLVGGICIYVFFLHLLGLEPRPWYFLILLAPAAVALDAILARITLGTLPWGRAAAAALVVLLSASECIKQSQWRQTNIDLVAATLRQQVQPQDLVLVSPWYFGVSLQRYYSTNGFTTLPPMDEIRIHRYDLMKKKMERENPIDPLLEQVRQALRSGHALWVAGLFQFPPPGPPQPTYPPYRGKIPIADATYFSSWMFQISALVQAHATSGGQLKIDVPDGAKINDLEDVPVYVFRGWKD